MQLPDVPTAVEAAPQEVRDKWRGCRGVSWSLEKQSGWRALQIRDIFRRQVLSAGFFSVCCGIIKDKGAIPQTIWYCEVVKELAACLAVSLGLPLLPRSCLVACRVALCATCVSSCTELLILFSSDALLLAAALTLA